MTSRSSRSRSSRSSRSRSSRSSSSRSRSSRSSSSRRRQRGGSSPLTGELFSSSTPEFLKTDFNSKNGFLTSVWGPSLWFVLHIISLNYPMAPSARNRREYRKFFDSLQHVLPCGICRDNLCRNLKCTGYGPHVFKSRSTLSRFVHKLHNCVSGMLGKDKCKLSYKDMRKMYENFRARCSLKNSSRRATRKKRAGEGGCTDPVSGIKSKCTLRIVPIDYCTSSIEIDKRCILRKCR